MLRFRAAVVVLAIVAGACSRGSSDPVQALIDDVADAAEARDADGVMARISDSFRGQDTMARGDLAAAVRRYFAAYESLDVEVFDVQAERGDGSARVQTRVGFKGEASRAFGLGGLLPPSAVYRFDLEARDEGGVWRVTRAEWAPVTPPPE